MERDQYIGNIDKSLFSRAYDSVRSYSSDLAKKVGRVAIATTLIGSSLLSFNSYAQDLDHDGILDSDEISTSTSVLDLDEDGVMDGYDTDKDGYPDGVEVVEGFDPNGFNEPVSEIYLMENSAPILSTDSNNRIMPTLSHDGTTYAYFKTSNFSTGQVYTTPVANPGVETALPNATVSNFDFQQLAFSPDDSKLYFGDGTGLSHDLFEYDIFSEEKTNLTNNPNNQYVFHPFVVSYPSSSGLGAGNLDWLYIATLGESGVGVSEISAYPIVSGIVNFGGKVRIADIGNFDYGGVEMYPRLDTDGGNLLFGILQGNEKSRTFIATGLEDILKGIEPIITEADNDPGSPNQRAQSADVATGWHQPIGFSPTGNIFYLAYDSSLTFTDSNKDFNTSDFNIYIGKVNLGNFGGFNKVPSVGEAFSGVVSKDGTKILYSINHDFTSTTNHNLFLADVSPVRRIPWAGGGGTMADDWTLTDSSGVEVVLIGGTTYTLPGASPNGAVKIISQALTDRVATDGIEAIRDFKPDGLRLGPGAKLVYSYLDSDVEKLKIPEDQLKIFEFNDATGNFDIEQTVLDRDTINNTIDVELTGFSNFGMRGVSDPNNVYVDFNNAENVAGTLSNPLNNFADAVTLSNNNAVIRIKPGTSSETGVFSKPLTIRKYGAGGPARIGVISRSASLSRANEDESESGFVSRQRE